MVSSPLPDRYTVDEYIAHEIATDSRFDYIDGEIFAMTGGTEQHSLIISNCIITLGQNIRGKDCRIYSSDMRVQISKSKFVYPDFSIVCGESIFADENRTMLTNPLVVAEVLSKSSADYDRGTKGDFYRSLPSVQAYLLLDQYRHYAQLYTRYGEKNDSSTWLLRDFHGLNAMIPLDIIDAQIALSDLYRDVQLT